MKKSQINPRGIDRVDVACRVGKSQSYASLPHDEKKRTHRSQKSLKLKLPYLGQLPKREVEAPFERVVKDTAHLSSVSLPRLKYIRHPDDTSSTSTSLMILNPVEKQPMQKESEGLAGAKAKTIRANGHVYPLVRKRKPFALMGFCSLPDQKNQNIPEKESTESQIKSTRESLFKMKHIASKLKDKNFILSRNYLKDTSYLVPPTFQPSLPTQQSVPALHIQRFQPQEQLRLESLLNSVPRNQKSMKIHVSPPPAVRRQISVLSSLGDEKQMRRQSIIAKKMDEGGKERKPSRVESDFITINKIATQLASTVRKNFQLGQSDVNKYIMSVQKTERGLQEEKRRYNSNRADREMLLLQKGMDVLRRSRDNSIASLEDKSVHSSYERVEEERAKRLEEIISERSARRPVFMRERLKSLGEKELLEEAERASSEKKRKKKKVFMKGLETRISMQVNELLEKNSIISGKIESHSSVGRTVNLKLISLLHRLKNRKQVIEEAYEHLLQKEEQEQQRPLFRSLDDRFHDLFQL